MFNGHVPVSYTHLDVYKRQAQHNVHVMRAQSKDDTRESFILDEIPISEMLKYRS